MQTRKYAKYLNLTFPPQFVISHVVLVFDLVDKIY